jgi:hypothetical protein
MNVSASQLGAAVQVAVQKNVLDHVKAQGASVAALIAAAPMPAGSVNSPSQGQHLDVRV